jgi:hypothetical protein
VFPLTKSIRTGGAGRRKDQNHESAVRVCPVEEGGRIEEREAVLSLWSSVQGHCSACENRAFRGKNESFLRSFTIPDWCERKVRASRPLMSRDFPNKHRIDDKFVIAMASDVQLINI